MTPEWAKLVPELYVSDLQKSLGLYVGVLGFSIKYGRPEEGFAYLDQDGAQIMLEELSKKGRQWQAEGLCYPFGRGINFQIEVSNVDELYLKVTESGCPIYLPLEDKWYRTGDVMGGNRQFIVQDPDGYLLRFFSSLGDKPIV